MMYAFNSKQSTENATGKKKFGNLVPRLFGVLTKTRDGVVKDVFALALHNKGVNC